MCNHSKNSVNQNVSCWLQKKVSLMKPLSINKFLIPLVQFWFRPSSKLNVTLWDSVTVIWPHSQIICIPTQPFYLYSCDQQLEYFTLAYTVWLLIPSNHPV
jgi:hypothetical protein